MSSIEKVNKSQDLRFENDLNEPLLGTVVKDPTCLGLSYLFGVAGIALFVPGFGFVSAIALAVLGFCDVSATLRVDNKLDKVKLLGLPSRDAATPKHTPVEKSSRTQPATALPPDRPSKPATPKHTPAYTKAPATAYDNNTYTQPNPWGPSIQRCYEEDAAALNAKLASLPLLDDEPEAFVSSSSPANVKAEPALSGSVVKSIPLAPATEAPLRPRAFSPVPTPAPTPTDLARRMATPDSDGYYRSRLLTAPTRTGKGLATQAALLHLKKELGDAVELFLIDAKNDPSEAYRWQLIDEGNRYQFSGAAPRIDGPDVADRVMAIVDLFYNSEAKYKFLVVSELKILMSALGKAGASVKTDFSAWLSSQACGGASRHSYIWIDTNVVGLKENGFNGSGDRNSFVCDYIVTEQNKVQITSHVTFDGPRAIDSAIFAESGRAEYSQLGKGWQAVPATYAEIDRTIKEATPTLDLATIEPELPDPTEEDARAISLILNTAVLEARALSLPLSAVAHRGIKAMSESDRTRKALDKTIELAISLKLINARKVGDEYTIQRPSKTA